MSGVLSRLAVPLADGFTSSATFRTGDPLDKLDVLVRDADAVCEFEIAGTWRDGFQLARGFAFSRPGLSELYQREGGIRAVRFRNLVAGQNATLTFVDLYSGPGQ